MLGIKTKKNSQKRTNDLYTNKTSTYQQEKLPKKDIMHRLVTF